ncbi:unnamed protein product [Durusdinium trenchii]|uniref:Uncharacterized protein n=1 Tax=Durusdinium trenchii TaxID=1381693 RepID=A0ABP0I6K2_9DINO
MSTVFFRVKVWNPLRSTIFGPARNGVPPALHSSTRVWLTEEDVHVGKGHSNFTCCFDSEGSSHQKTYILRGGLATGQKQISLNTGDGTVEVFFFMPGAYVASRIPNIRYHQLSCGGMRSRMGWSD